MLSKKKINMQLYIQHSWQNQIKIKSKQQGQLFILGLVAPTLIEWVVETKILRDVLIHPSGPSQGLILWKIRWRKMEQITFVSKPKPFVAIFKEVPDFLFAGWSLPSDTTQKPAENYSLFILVQISDTSWRWTGSWRDTQVAEQHG